MFSKWEENGTSGEKTQDGTTNAKPSNLAVWSSSGNSWINEDLTGSNVNTGWSNGGSQVLEAQEEDSSTGTALSETTKSATKKHNGVEWKYEKNSTSGEISITGTVNIYKSKHPSNSTNYQTAFKTNNLIKLISKS